MILSIVLLLLGKRAKSNQRKNISTNAKQLGKLDGSGPAENFV